MRLVLRLLLSSHYLGVTSYAHWMMSSGRCGHQDVHSGSPDASLLRIMAPYLLTMEEVKEVWCASQ